jgi:hypothetical protein
MDPGGDAALAAEETVGDAGERRGADRGDGHAAWIADRRGNPSRKSQKSRRCANPWVDWTAGGGPIRRGDRLAEVDEVDATSGWGGLSLLAEWPCGCGGVIKEGCSAGIRGVFQIRGV